VKRRRKPRNLRRTIMRKYKTFKQKEKQRRNRKKRRNLTKLLLILRKKSIQPQKQRRGKGQRLRRKIPRNPKRRLL